MLFNIIVHVFIFMILYTGIYMLQNAWGGHRTSSRSPRLPPCQGKDSFFLPCCIVEASWLVGFQMIPIFTSHRILGRFWESNHRSSPSLGGRYFYLWTISQAPFTFSRVILPFKIAICLLLLNT